MPRFPSLAITWLGIFLLGIGVLASGASLVLPGPSERLDVFVDVIFLGLGLTATGAMVIGVE